MPKNTDRAQPDGSLTVVGTGFLIAGQLTPESKRALVSADRTFYLVAEKATSSLIRELSPGAENLFDSYAVGRHRIETYREMTERILEPVRAGKQVCAAFYGHPGVFVTPSHEAIRIAREEGYGARMLPGISAEDCLFADAEIDPARAGCQSFEATDFLIRRRRFDPTAGLVLWQVGAIAEKSIVMKKDIWNRAGLAHLISTLEEHYPADHPVILYEARSLPVAESIVQRVRLSEVPTAQVSVVSTMYLPPLPPRPADPTTLERLGLSRPVSV